MLKGNYPAHLELSNWCFRMAVVELTEYKPAETEQAVRWPHNPDRKTVPTNRGIYRPPQSLLEKEARDRGDLHHCLMGVRVPGARGLELRYR